MKVQKDSFARIGHAVSAALVVATFVHVAVSWGTMPDSIPAHYGLDGTPDAWGGKGSALVAPCAMLLIFGAFFVASRHPGSWNTGVTVTEENRDAVYRVLGRLIASIEAISALWLAAVSFIQVEEVRQPWFLLPAMLVLLIGALAFWIRRLYRLK